MDEHWYYDDGQGAVGPMSIVELKELLPTFLDWKKILVWADGRPDWKRAGTLTEFSVLPPPLPMSEALQKIARTLATDREPLSATHNEPLSEVGGPLPSDVVKFPKKHRRDYDKPVAAVGANARTSREWSLMQRARLQDNDPPSDDDTDK